MSGDATAPPAAAPATPPAAPAAGTNGAAEPAVAPEGPSELEVMTGKHRDVLLSASRVEQENRSMKERLKEYETQGTVAAELAERLKSNPLEALKHHGHTHQGLTDHLIDAEENPETSEQMEMRTLKETVSSLQEQLKGTTDNLSAKDAQVQYDLRLGNINTYVEQKGEEFSAIKALGKTGAILDGINELAEQRGQSYSDDEVIETLRESEQAIRAQLEPQIKGLASLPWARLLFETALKPAEEKPDPPASKGQPAAKPKKSASKPGRNTITDAEATEVETGTAPLVATDSGKRHANAAARIAKRRAQTAVR